MRYRTAPYLSLLNFLLFSAFVGCLWTISSYTQGTIGKIGPTEIQMLMLQSVSALLMVGVFQMSPKKDKVWRAVLVSMAFIALSESTLVALLTPVA